jgi:predicted deacylase
MQITRVEYEGVFNLGNYENEKIRIAMTLTPDDSLDAAIKQLREQAIKNAQVDASEAYYKRQALMTEIKELEAKAEAARSQWTQTAEFLKVQGLRSDPPEMPQFINLFPEVQQEKVVVQEDESPLAGEII